MTSGSGDDEQAEGRVAAKGAELGLTPLFFGELLGVRLDAAFDHCVCAVQGSTAPGHHSISIGRAAPVGDITASLEDSIRREDTTAGHRR